LIEFRSASSEGSGRKEEEEVDRIAVKPNSADKYVGRPDNQSYYDKNINNRNNPYLYV